ncbi:substance-P receptor-like isoform X2 [Actinia tenebrosa]|uniref:Substance-P receptor-like isoform X2 n=1 Tax=Actinia tenebrosa TaxID=6105 RepID=A0A6P8HWD3_ACTTE|nr:substance-P receptor-like isoform X2 [Actinia tenebrosa]XP_031556966.1 substance-P receptor-like isoform X2 [Actinia tenebrosa]
MDPGVQNSSNINQTQPIQLGGEPEYSVVIRFLLFGAIILVSLVGNIAVIFITYRNRQMRTFAYFLIANLALADVLATLCLPIIVAYLEIGKWVFGEVMCKLVNPSITVFAVVTSNTLVAIACDRFRALIFPFKLKPSTSETRLIIALIWMIAFLVTLPSYGSRTVTIDGYCLEIYSSDTEQQILYVKIYTTFMFLVNNFIPLLVILILYIKISMTLAHITLFPSLHFNRPSSLAQDSPGESPRNSVLLRNANTASATKRQTMERKFIRMLLTVVLIFFFCYVPFQVFFLIWSYLDLTKVVDNKALYYCNHYLHILMWLPTALNPICYAALNERYAKYFKRILRCSFSKLKQFGTTANPSGYTAASRRKSSPLSV